MLGKVILKATGLSVGCLVEVRFRLEPAEAVEIPQLLVRAVAESGSATERWEALSPGKQRAIGHHVQSAKTRVTGAKRVAQAILWLEGGHTDLRPLPKLTP